MLVALGCFSMGAQNSIFNNPDNKAYFGIRVGGDITCPGNFKADHIGIKMFKNGGGVEFGGIFNAPLVANLYIEPGLKFFYDTYSSDDLYSINEDISEKLDMSINKFGIRVPVMLGYHFDFTDDVKVSVFTGPELEVGLSGKGKIKYSGYKESESIYGDEGGWNRINLLWTVGASVSYQNYYFGVSGGIGMLNMLSDSDVKFHENRVTISLGYNF